jgi:hypothetical protein
VIFTWIEDFKGKRPGSINVSVYLSGERKVLTYQKEGSSRQWWKVVTNISQTLHASSIKY